MKARESGMPGESMWAGFFDPPAVLAKLRFTPGVRCAVEFGCGYGTFTLPAARITRGVVHAFDIEPAMIDLVRVRAQEAGLDNVRLAVRDFIDQGTGLPDSVGDYAMMFNILHAERPLLLLREALRLLRAGGLLGIMHWNHDPLTPRGPSMDIRPRPEDCRAWAEQIGFRLAGTELIDLPPYHYGIVMVKPPTAPRRIEIP